MAEITTFLWFDDDLQGALDFYQGIFADSRVVEAQNAVDGSLFTAVFELAGRRFMGLNGGPGHPFTDAVSLMVTCADQAEVDRLWDALLAGGGKPVACGWLADRFGLSWQIVPSGLFELLNDPDPARAKRAVDVMLTQVKIDLAEIERAADAVG